MVIVPNTASNAFLIALYIVNSVVVVISDLVFKVYIRFILFLRADIVKLLIELKSRT